MNNFELEFNLHDSVIVNAKYKEIGRLELEIQLYEIYYPGDQYINLIISGIFNKEKVQSFFTELISDSWEPNWIGHRIDVFHYDTKKVSTTNNRYLYLGVDHCKPLKIHCRKINFIKLGSNNEK